MGFSNRKPRITQEEAVASAQQLEEEGANAVFIMTTAQYPFGKFIEISQEVKIILNPKPR